MGGRRVLARSEYRLGLRDRPDEPGPSGAGRAPTGPRVQLLVGRQGLGELARRGRGSAAGAPAGGASPFDAARFDAPRRPASRPGEGGLPGNGNWRRPDGVLRAGRRPDGRLRRRPGWPGGPVGPGGPGGPGGPAGGPGGPGGPQGQAQGRLVAALDVEEGARRRRRRVRGVHPRPRRRLLLPGQHRPRSRPRSPPTCSTRPRPSTTATARRPSARSAPSTGRT